MSMADAVPFVKVFLHVELLNRKILHVIGL
jgi:hypothetical protein